MGPSPVQGLTYGRAGRIAEHRIGNPISTALEPVRSLSATCIKILQCCHFVVLAYMAIVARWQLVYLK